MASNRPSSDTSRKFPLFLLKNFDLNSHVFHFVKMKGGKSLSHNIRSSFLSIITSCKRQIGICEFYNRKKKRKSINSFVFIKIYVKFEVTCMTDDEMVEILKKISEEISAIKRYARFQARDAISTMLNKVATTPERQQMWRLADGTHSNEEIANQIGVSLRSVQYFVQEAESAGLIIVERRGYPKRMEDIVPPEWKPWRQKKVKVETQPMPQETATTEEKQNV